MSRWPLFSLRTFDSCPFSISHVLRNLFGLVFRKNLPTLSFVCISRPDHVFQAAFVLWTDFLPPDLVKRRSRNILINQELCCFQYWPLDMWHRRKKCLYWENMKTHLSASWGNVRWPSLDLVPMPHPSVTDQWSPDWGTCFHLYLFIFFTISSSFSLLVHTLPSLAKYI